MQTVQQASHSRNWHCMQAAISLQNLIQRAVISTQQIQQQFHITKRLVQL